MYKTIKESLPEFVKEEDSVIVDIAGKDSAAAIVKFLQLNPDTKKVIPIVVKSPTEYGDNKLFEKSYKEFIHRLKKKFGVIVTKEIFIEEPLLWRLLNGKYVSIFLKKFDFYSPCPGCHLYVHSIRGYIGMKLGVKLIISGERLRHENKIKINQLDVSLNSHEKLLQHFGIYHSQPLKFISRDKEILQILNIIGINKIYHYNCIFSGNYIDIYNKCAIPENLEDFYDYMINLTQEYFLNFGKFDSYNDLEKVVDNFIKVTLDSYILNSNK